MTHGVDGPFDQDGPNGQDRPVNRDEGGHAPPPRRPPGPGTGPYPRPRPPHPGGRAPYPHPPGPPTAPGWRRQYPPPAPVPPPGPPPMPAMPPIPPAPPPEPRGVMWAFVPFISLGFGTPFSFMYAAVRRQSWNLGAAAAGYGAATGSAMLMAQSGDAMLGALSAIMFLMLWVAGSVHAFAVRPAVFPKAAPHSQRNEHAIKLAKYRRVLREDARALATEDPALAHELRIGRPDLPRGYDDGGLVDVNHAPPSALAMLPGLTDEHVERIVRRREEQGGFFSAEEMAVDIDLPPALLAQIAEYALFLP
ncbi:helix-hairpin-helix domain-containing protein [Spirillospora sp. NPDC029432]|uniref:ComEA family DNA-binding protein n=1 Tax=Spirillospora sp. NPDC029432 TaxID=3154599 RepID=UPI00345555BD